MAAGVACGSCGTGLRAEAKFCDRCGAPTAAIADTAEYKQVTVLFADVVRSMDIAAALDVERLREIMTELVERVTAVVRRYGGGTVEYTGDGVMAIFGAPVALEDHAFRACLAALGIQQEVNRLATEVHRRDGVALRLRVGLNSGRVIAGEVGSGPLRYAATGEPVGMAQRIESVAPPGGVMLSESTARLVEHSVMLAEPDWVCIKGADEPVCARRLLGIGPRHPPVGRTEASLIGRRWEMAALDAIIDRAVGGRGGVVHVVGPPGIGKSRMAREAANAAAGRGVQVVWAFCESHARDLSFHVVARLLRAGSGVADLDGQAARTRVRDQFRDADPQDLLLLDDLLGIADPNVALPQIDPDARRRRLTALINAASLARTEPVLFIVEDAQWIDAVSEAMIADFLTVVPHTASVVLITARPEYQGPLMRAPGAQTIALTALRDSETVALLAELLGADPSAGGLAAIIAERAAGNPFFAEEMVRELAQRGVLSGAAGSYVCHTDVAEVSVPATVQATIEARIDRLSAPAKRTLTAASVIGARFEAELLAGLGVDAVVDELLGAELIDQVRFTPSAEYAFRHPLIRAVAYESQLKADRARLHQHVASAIESHDPAAADENAALIAEHLEAAGDLRAAYQWHMRAANWATYRDIVASRRSWERARAIADALPAEDPDRTAMRIAPRTMLCGIAWRIQMDVAGDRFDELRELCSTAGDNASLAIGMAGLVLDHAFKGRIREASQLASEAMVLVESIGDATLTVGLSFPVTYAKAQSGEWDVLLRWSQRAIELADGDASKGNFIIGSPLALALVTRAAARYCLGRPGWPDDLRHGMSMARSADPLSYATVVTYVYFPGIAFGVLRPHDSALREIEDALGIAERSGDDLAVVWARVTLGHALVHRQTDAERSSGRKLLTEASEAFRRRGHSLSELPLVNAYLAREKARRGDRHEAIPLMRAAVGDRVSDRQPLAWGYAIPAIGVLAETLLENGTESDVAQAEAMIERLASAPADDDLAMRDIWLLRLRALAAQARGDDVAHRDLVNRYRAMAERLGFEGHIAWAETMLGNWPTHP
ncbi:regulatory protein [Mycobacterium leprae TN] [Mycobacterium shimoidei]|uniref:Regulatory protein [Mycobacterium leprae TN] n=1 Tax=Mycobacterium shimoidei TaxID=29313 RepID=A0A375Z4W9_MYCSH|nr:adenylate/guanylate cyclase domain-containing protein [Mycobacterium shimoidei]SRX96178.1 regulatory protein [Mycobacterium leprae TN] [Mycobacterium shimoidei]